MNDIRRAPTGMNLSLVLAVLLFTPIPALAQTPVPAPSPAPASTDQEMERFLLHAEIIKSRSAGKGVTGSERVTLREGSATHDAHVQTIDEQKKQGPGAGGVEFNFRDSWMYNIAAYRLDRLIGLNLVPVSVERRYRSARAAYTWWIDDVVMDEKSRLARKLSPPDVEQWNQEMQLVRVFDQLIYNVDRNVGNLLIAKDWRLWAIDHTRAFRTQHALKQPREITRCDRGLLERLRQLDRPTLSRDLGRWLNGYEIDALLARRDAIVTLIDRAGPSALFDRMRNAPSGTRP